MPRASGRSKAKAAEPQKESEAEAVAEVPVDDVASDHVKEGRKGKGPDVREVSLANELEEMTKKMHMISIEKEVAELMLKQRDAQLEQQHVEEQRLQSLLEAKDQEQKKLEEKVRKLQKTREFQPTIDLELKTGAASKDTKKKDPNHIKKPMTAFMLWSKDQRDQVKRDHPEANFAEMSKLLGEKWKNVSEEEKKPYEERYQVEKEVYLKVVGEEKRSIEAMKIFQEEQNKKTALDLLEQYLQFQNEKADDGKKKKKEKDPEKPKKPTTGFFVFSNERRPLLLADKMKVTEIGKKLGEEWKALDENKRQPYEKVAAVDRARYATELEAYKLRKAAELEQAHEQSKEQEMIHKAQGMQLLKQREEMDQVKKSLKEEKLKKKRTKAETTDPNKPKRPPTSYILFLMENRKLIQKQKPGASFSEITGTLAVKWQELPEAEKQNWADKAAAARDTYKKAIEEYNTNLTVSSEA